LQKEIFIHNAGELRKKKVRINSLCVNFRKLGIPIEEYEDGLAIRKNK
jgi:5-enolpyruvylshikimate-3-phosphate synthase